MDKDKGYDVSGVFEHCTGPINLNFPTTQEILEQLHATVPSVKELRIKTGLSQSKFAAYFELPVRTLQSWEQGQQQPPEYVVKLIQRVWQLEHPEKS